MVKISKISTYLPSHIVTNKSLLSDVIFQDYHLDASVLERIFGIKERRFASATEQVSDLGYKAAIPIIKQVGRNNIDLLIFAAACSDLIEPATCNIVQNKLGLVCPAMDIKNACNSVVTAIHTATAFIESNIYENILIVSGEKLSNAINYNIRSQEELKTAISAFTLGDAGAALLLTKSDDMSGFYHQKFMTVGKYWEISTIKGGGSMFPHDSTKNYFVSDSGILRKALIDEGRDFIIETILDAEWKLEDIDHLVTHQVSQPTFEIICREIGIDQKKCINVFTNHGNMASVSIPFTLNHGVVSKRIQKGDKVLILGLAAGISASVQLMIW